ncbi:MAG: sigma-54-dependent transcriptional regulator [Opitutaceae bacterium]
MDEQVTAASSQNEISILVVDDSSVDRRMIAAACSQLDGSLEMAASGEEALEKFKDKRYRLVITDYIMEPMSGLDLATELRELDPDVEVIIVSGSPTPEVMAYVQSNELSPVMTKPITPQALINRAIVSLERYRGRREAIKGVALTNRMDECLPLVGHSAPCQKLRDEVAGLLHSSSPLLISGPVGSGKSQIAALLHLEGVYGDSVCVECFCQNETPEEMSRSLISEDGVFGDMIGLAKNGTLIIHNIEALPLSLQHAVAENYDALLAEVHLIVLSDVCLDELLASGEMDESLYFKLSLETLNVPALSDRLEDVEDIAAFILKTPELYGIRKGLSVENVADRVGQLKGNRSETLNLSTVIAQLRAFSEAI